MTESIFFSSSPGITCEEKAGLERVELRSEFEFLPLFLLPLNHPLFHFFTPSP